MSIIVKIRIITIIEKKYLVLLYNGNKLYNRIYKFIRR